MCLGKHPLGHIVAPEIGGLEIAEHALGRAVARLAHEVGDLGLIVDPGGE